MRMQGRSRLGALASALLLAGAAGAYHLLSPRDSAPAAGEAPPVIDFSLVDHRRAPATPADFPGRWLLVMFGFTHCPDVCPNGLATLSRVVERLGEDAERLQPLMISVDPERDTPESLAGYIEHFHPAILGLTGTPAQVAQAAASFRAYYVKVPYGENGDYTVDHSAFLYLIDPAREFAEMYPHGMRAEAIADSLTSHLSGAGGSG